VIDRKCRRFNLLGPGHDDSEIVRRVAALQDEGRDVALANEERTWLSDAAVIAQAEAFHRCTYTPDPII
jgi:hypothetical protein